MSEPQAPDATPRITPAPAGLPPLGRLRDALDRRADWVEALIVLTTVAVAFVVLGFLASYFKDYLHLILIFFLGVVAGVPHLTGRRLAAATADSGSRDRSPSWR